MYQGLRILPDAHKGRHYMSPCRPFQSCSDAPCGRQAPRLATRFPDKLKREERNVVFLPCIALFQVVTGCEQANCEGQRRQHATLHLRRHRHLYC